MGQTIHTIYENGVFRPTEKVELPEHCAVEFHIHEVRDELGQPTLDEVYQVLGMRHATGDSGISARHDEHQP